MAKALRPATIIPPQLYVERAADRQLDEIVEEMGRPGYVLVARQMGKTNLLINMKRRREQLGDVVSYFDLSNRPDEPRALFRQVIDSILDAAPHLFESVEKSAALQRENVAVEANVEFDRHLRAILKEIPEKNWS